MLNKFFQFLKGYVIISIMGSDAERFINICVRRGIDIFDIKVQQDGGFLARVTKKDFFLLRPIAYKTKTKIRIIKKKGLSEIRKKYSHRYFFVGGAIFMITFFAVMSQFIWVVKIDGIYESSQEQVIQILEECGIRPGVLKRSIPPISDIKYKLINETDTISWAWVYIEGACARVEVYERRLKPQIADKDTPCSILAATDAFIVSMDVKNGHRMVNNYTSVSAGDVLISGRVPVFREGYPEEYITVHSQGVIEALTYYSEEKDQPLYYESRIKTGRKKTYYSLEIFGKLFKLFKNDEPSFENYDVKETRHELTLPYFGYVGLCINEKVCTEVEIYREPITEETAAHIAQEELEEKITKKLLKNPRLQTRELEWERLDNDTIRVRLKMSFLEDIGTEITINEE